MLSQIEDDDDNNPEIEDNKEESSGKNKTPVDTLKIDFNVDIPVYRGDVDAEKLDSWIDTLETYFTVDKYSNSQKIKFANLKLTSHMPLHGGNLTENGMIYLK